MLRTAITRHVILVDVTSRTFPTYPSIYYRALMASIGLRAFRQQSALCRREVLGSCIKHYSTELPRPPPSTTKPVVETFSATSKPRPYYAKHPPHRELPKIKVRPRCISRSCPYTKCCSPDGLLRSLHWPLPCSGGRGSWRTSRIRRNFRALYLGASCEP